MSVRDELYSKVSCCFANKVYQYYLQKRYGVNNCKVVDMEEIESLERLKDLFYFKTTMQRVDYLDNFNPIKNTCTDVCNMALIIERINLL